MALLFRLLLISLLIYLVVKLVRDTIYGSDKGDRDLKSDGSSRKVSRDTGEYVDYEEVKDDEGRKTNGFLQGSLLTTHISLLISHL